MKLFFKRFWPTLCVVAIIIYATLNSDPVPDMDMQLFPHLNKLIHAIMFGGLYGALLFDLYRSGKPLTRSICLYVAATCVMAGALDEFLQACLTDNRDSDILDWLADCAGIAVAFFTAPSAVKAVVRNGNVKSR